MEVGREKPDMKPAIKHRNTDDLDGSEGTRTQRKSTLTGRLSLKQKALFVVGLAGLASVLVLRWKKKAQEKLSPTDLTPRGEGNTRRTRLSLDRTKKQKRPKDIVFRQPSLANDTIFVALPCGPGREVEAARLAGLILTKASDPSRVVIGVCRSSVLAQATLRRREGSGWYSQTFAEVVLRESSVSGIDDFLPNIHVIDEPINERRGFSNAMNLIERYLFRGERYFCTMALQSIPQEDWDTKAVNDLQRAYKLENNVRCAISYLPTAVDATRGSSSSVLLSSHLCARGWTERGLPLLVPRTYKGVGVRPFRALFHTSAFFFAPGRVVSDCTHDPWYEFTPRAAVDWVYGLRLWTSGWTCYDPSVPPVLLRSDAGAAPCRYLSDQAQVSDQAAMHERSWWRVWSLMRVTLPVDGWSTSSEPQIAGSHVGRPDLTGFDLGTTRTLLSFTESTGVDWFGRRLLPHAVVGMFLKPTRGDSPFLQEEIAAKYGTWAEFYETTDYRAQ